jgi:primase-polymerase (primpol)-like protein
MPIQAVGGRPASSTNSSTWSTHSSAARSRHGAGLGFVLVQGDGLVCIDLDHCVRPDRSLEPWAQAIVDRCPPTFVEVSASGDGLHIWGCGEMPRGRRIRRGDGAQIEVYGTGRYIAVTGNRFENAPAELADLSEVITSHT